MAALLASLRVFEKAGGMAQVRLKSLALTGYLETLLHTYGLTVCCHPDGPSLARAVLTEIHLCHACSC
jgi:kynureninase|eukprot:COSAG01_NODE_2421_length_7726_cov_72.763472_4_plen_68_part_00